MMNSNNVLCCYLEVTSSVYNFGAGDDCQWNNKKWRALVYFTKDIILCGKSYPYRCEVLDKEVISFVKKLAEDNLNYHYHYGPELYKDMKHINEIDRVAKNRFWIRRNQTIKHNIIFDTNGMYNDILNNNSYNFWCYRNKVKRNKLIQLSGKANCLCCNDNIIDLSDINWYDGYNDKYENTGSLLCKSCSIDYTCEKCDGVFRKVYELENKEGETIKVCEDCFESWVHMCPVCGEIFLENSKTPYIEIEKDPSDNHYYFFVVCSTECMNKLSVNNHVRMEETHWGTPKYVLRREFKDMYYDKYKTELDKNKVKLIKF